MTRNDTQQRPDADRTLLGFRWRHLDLVHDGVTFLRRRGLEHVRLGGVLIHFLDGPDPGLDLHDHPWSFATFVLWGGYTEEWEETRLAELHARVSDGVPGARPGLPRTWARWTLHRMPLDVAHRITAVEPHTITIVLRRPKGRPWGFYPPTGWVPWERYDYDTRRPVGVRSNRPGEAR